MAPLAPIPLAPIPAMPGALAGVKPRGRGGVRPRSLGRHWAPLAPLALVAMLSHTRPAQMPKARRMRMQRRPKESFLRPTGLSCPAEVSGFSAGWWRGKMGSKTQELFLTSPCRMEDAPGASRSDAFSKLRAKLKKTRSRKTLVKLLQKAVDEGCTEVSVFSAAMQTCGNQCFWESLLEVRRMQQEAVKLDAKGGSIALTALNWCLRKNGVNDVREERKEPALCMAREIWQEVGGANDAVLSSALRLCAELESETARSWGLSLWTEAAGLERSDIARSAFIMMLEKYGDCERVDQCLEAGKVSPVLLGALLDCAAGRLDLARAELLWARLVLGGQVKPIESTYNALARAYLLAGEPKAAAEKIDEMLSERIGKITWINAKLYAQALLLIWHSEPTEQNKERLARFVGGEEARRALEDQPPKRALQEWAALRSAVELEEPRLQDVLVT
ncbi:unnamed protein product, partial [Effrenium voratum]